MADKIDMSLDDIIKINKKKGGAKTRTPSVNPKAARSKIRPKVPPPQQRKAQPQRQQRQQLQSSATKDPGQTMLHVSNLDFGVSNKDLKELFEEVGPIKKASVHYDRSGRSLGTAEVVFWKRDAAIQAIKEYNMRILDGRPMSIALVPTRTNPVATSPKVMGVRKGSGIQKKSPQKLGGGKLKNQSQNKSPKKGAGAANKSGPRRTGKPGGTRQPKKEISAQQLDDDLEAYKNQMVVD